MKLRRSLYARPVIVRGQQCAEARPGRRGDQAAAWWCEGTTRVRVSACGRSAWRPKRVRMPAVVSSPCPRSCPASGVQCPVRASGVRRGPVQVTGVRCGRLSVQVSSVRRPVSVRRGVRRGVRLRGVAVGPAAVRLGMAGVGVVARHVHDGASSARGWSLALEAGAGRAGPAKGRLGLGRRRGRWLALGQADRERLDAREDRPSEGSWW